VEKVQICHDPDAMSRTKILNAACTEVPNVSSAQDVCVPIRSGVQDRIIGWVKQHERPDDHGLNHVRHIRQVSGKPCRFIGSDSIARLYSRI
jgi:hypothetical protein